MPVQEDATRAQLLRRAIIVRRRDRRRGATWGLPQLTAAASKEQDARVLNLVLAVEYTEAAFYREALERGGLRRRSRRTTPRSSSSTRRPTSRSSSRRWAPRPSRRRATSSATRRRMPKAFTAAAVKLEDLAVATYNGQAVNLTPASLKAAARIVSVEARHAAWIRSIAGDVPATEATDPAVKEAETRARLSDFGWKAGVSRMDFLLDDLDTDGALREAGENAGISRATFLGGTVAGAVAAFAIAPTAEAAGSHDVAVLNFALVLEYLQSSFYTEAERSKALRGKADDAATRVGAVERAHVAAFKQLLGPQSGQAAGVRLPRHDRGRAAVPQDGRRVRGPRGGGLQGPGAAAALQAGARRGRRDPFRRGAPRGLDALPVRRAAGGQRVR